jgi:hypothetical protein
VVKCRRGYLVDIEIALAVAVTDNEHSARSYVPGRRTAGAFCFFGTP